MDPDASDKRHKHHKKHKHKKHKKHKSSKSSGSIKHTTTNEGDDGSTEQEVELDRIEYNMNVIEDGVTLPLDEHHFLMDAEHCEGALEVIEELVEIDENEIGTINIEEMVLENYGQDYEELDVDVDGMDEEILEDIEEDLLDELEDSEGEEEEDQIEDISVSDKFKPIQPPEDLAKASTSSSKRVRDRSKRTRDDGDGSSGEEAWLKALESGKLEEVDDELKKIKNPKLMTVRQRALLERKGELQTEEVIKEELVALPTGYKETVMTAELLKKKELKSQRRREVAAQKREKEKKRTIDRLLQKKESKPNKSSARDTRDPGGASASAASTSAASSGGVVGGVPAASHVSSCFTWKQTSDGQISLSLPRGVEFPLSRQTSREEPVVVRCGVPGCPNPKRYSCSKTVVPLCSLQCYRENLKLHQIETRPS